MSAINLVNSIVRRPPAVPSPPVGDALSASYEGPVFVTTVAGTLTDPADPACLRGNTGGLVYGSQKLLASVAALGIPLVYLATAADAAALKQYPQGRVITASTDPERQAALQSLGSAHLFELGNDGGTDAAVYQQAGGHAYILNVKPDQTSLPSNFHGILSDNFTERFQERVLGDLQADLAGRSADSSAPWQAPVPMAPVSAVGKFLHDLQPALGYAGGVPLEAAGHLIDRLFHSGESRQVAQSSEQMQRLSAPALADLAARMMRSGDGAGQDFMKLITGHGTGAADVDPVLVQIPGGFHAEKYLTGSARDQFMALRAGHQAVPGDWAAFDRYLDKATGTVARDGSKVEPLINGGTAFPAMYDAIDKANSSVNYSIFAMQSDETGWEMARHLADAADRGCQVRLLYDPIGSANSNGAPTDPKLFDYLRQHGVEVKAQPVQTTHVTHRKILVTDGQVGFVGGMNCGNEYHDTWHDVHSRVTGLAVADLQRLFVEQWQRNGGVFPAEAQHRMFPPLEAVQSGGTARIVGHIGRQDQHLKLAYLRAIDTAETSINIADPYFTDEDVAEHLAAAARRGVRVRVVMPQHNDNTTLQSIERSMYPGLLAAGVELYEFTGNPMAHEKVATFDGRLSTIGTSNLDRRSLDYNDESNVWSQDPATALDLDRKLFERDVQNSVRITGWKPTGVAALLQRLAVLQRPLQ